VTRPTGDHGGYGVPGTPGAKGDPGDTGARGVAGSTGLRGPRGIDADDSPGQFTLDLVGKLTLAVLALMAAVVGCLAVYLTTYVQEQRVLSECTAQSLNELNDSLVITVGAAGRDRRGLLALLTSLTDPERTREQRVADLEEYKQVLAASEAERAINPIRPARAC
jgi:hypothetical protein